MIDLHCHSSASDGMYEPEELVKKAHDEGIKVLALTDHDTVDGLDQAKKTADKLNMIFVPGIELNIDWPKGEFHLLGLNFQKESKSLSEIITFLKNDRMERNLYILEKMNEHGIRCSLDDIKKISGDAVIGRPHFAQYLLEIKKVRTRQQAFDKYLSFGKPFYVKRTGVNLDEAIVAICESGGIPVIAHPLSLYLSWGKIEDVLQNLFERGVQGLEAWHPGARFVDCQRLEKMARKIGFFITAGSDFHGEKIRSDRKLGFTAGGKKIDDKFWTDELKKAIEKQ
ncbi:MAG: PHP domain-containing protein [Treponema sp.]|nr:PHP domain-containing protein [Treponema sp.]